MGAGSWGTALAVHLARVGHEVHLCARDAGLAARCATTRENADYLPGVALPDGVRADARADDAVAGASMIVWAVPSHGTRATLRALAGAVRPGTVVVSATKGLERVTWTACPRCWPRSCRRRVPVVVLSGPSFAHEVARELPTAVVAASTDAAASLPCRRSSAASASASTRPTTWSASRSAARYKNVIAIAAGVVEGLGLGHNALAGPHHARAGRDVAPGGGDGRAAARRWPA